MPEIPRIPITASFVDAWRQTHHAAQIASEVGKAWGRPQPDDSHSSFSFEGGALLGAEVPCARPFRAALLVASLGLELRDREGRTLAARPLAGCTAREGMAWVRATAARLAGEGPRQPAVPAPDLPPHPVAQGAPFAPSPASSAELARLLAAADALLGRFSDGAPVRCWPHHFDLATLLVAARYRNGEPSATIGLGLAVPDAIEGSGYWYVSPWSASGSARPIAWPPLAYGRWLPRDGTLPIAALTLAEVAAIPDAAARREVLTGFLSGAIAACRSAL
jgi:hypothetical protein